MSSTASRVYSSAYVRFLQQAESKAEHRARERANPYVRPALRLSFDAGWFARGRRVQLGEGFTSPYLSKLCRAAWRRGVEARIEREKGSKRG